MIHPLHYIHKYMYEYRQGKRVCATVVLYMFHFIKLFLFVFDETNGRTVKILKIGWYVAFWCGVVCWRSVMVIIVIKTNRHVNNKMSRQRYVTKVNIIFKRVRETTSGERERERLVWRWAQRCIRGRWRKRRTDTVCASVRVCAEITFGWVTY